MAKRYDVLIFGGGAAGLAAARYLKEAGKRALILEARPRLGGRMWTKGVGPLPLELGAEFVHGEATVTTRLCSELGLTLLEAQDKHYRRVGGGWTDGGDFWEQLAASFARIPAAGDRSFADYARDTLSPKAAKAACRFVESFHGAPADKISAASLRQTREEFESGGRARRILGGYGALVDKLSGVDARLGERLVSVSWRRGRVGAVTSAGSYSARAAVVTLPLGVLQKGGVRFSPALDEKADAIAGLSMGQALRVSFSLERPVWEGRAPSACFWHDEQGEFPVWWSGPLQRRPVITAWAGGPRAPSLSRGAKRLALAQLARLSRAPISRVEKELRETATHDWSRDEFSFGAYSFACVNKKIAHEKLSRAISRTLFFAGEATISDGESATVEGALRSGERAAKNIFK